ncbi:MAG: isoprenylcysteine carboxylmethyltransferase family protein [Bacteroides sp.]|nr:isoprenylcysteine carboxylmethyltransferase family protein [Eubacterium sp.]MCM1418248.1 isoprenylcysteine carboxylmethyltransferase family protein [Roseburia sp.]MCM1462370.1 isoprenylcysteine carboxylmethyltransferase family protein [Bacteroides sp.]
MKNKEHLPMYGVGPIYVGAILLLTVAAVILGQSEPLKAGRVDALKLPFFVIGVLSIAYGIVLWCGAVLRSGIDDGITENKLVTSGVYSLCRNPIYSAFMLVCTGALFISGNVFFLPLFFVFWGFMTILMKNTEEKWLGELYGEEYHDYCKRVNRCIPIAKARSYNTNNR